MAITKYIELFVCMYRGVTDIDLYDAIDLILTLEDIKTKEDLDVLCGGKGRKLLYNRVKRISKTHWNKINEPEASIRAHYEKKLLGYKAYNGVIPYDKSYDKGYDSGYKSLDFNVGNCDPDGYEEGFYEGRQEALQNEYPNTIYDMNKTRINACGSNCNIGDIVTFKSNNSTKFCRITGIKEKSISVVDIQIYRDNRINRFKDIATDNIHKGHLNFSRKLEVIGKCNW